MAQEVPDLAQVEEKRELRLLLFRRQRDADGDDRALFVDVAHDQFHRSERDAVGVFGAPAETILHQFSDRLVLFSRLELRTVGGLQFTRRAQWQWGKTFGLYLIWYGLGRTWFESIRRDPSVTFLGIRSNVWGALAAILLGIIIIAVQNRRHTGVEPSPYRPGREWVDPATVDSEDTYSDTDDESDDAPGASPQKSAATSGATTGS